MIDYAYDPELLKRAKATKWYRTTPKDIRCRWTARRGEPGTYDCPDCGCWTANLPLYLQSVCPAKDRRKGDADRRAGITGRVERG